MTQMNYSPELPLDVARLLLEVAAWSDRSTLSQKMSIIDPILHHTIVLDTPTRVSAFAISVIARNDVEFFRRTVKVLTIGNLESGYFSKDNIDVRVLNDVTVILIACKGVERFSYRTSAGFQISDHHRRNSFPSLFTMVSPSLTHLHLTFDLFIQFVIYDNRHTWTAILEEAPGLTHLQLSGTALENLYPLDFHVAFDSIVSRVLAHTLTRLRLIVNAMPHTDTHIPVQFKALRDDSRVIFILPTDHTLNAVEELRPYDKTRDGRFNWGLRGDIDCGGFWKIY
ncbi:hypothetical protein CPB85DRAFT_1435645 [Mucidula mucida]|nr:hypothetical protein CPB85DRAFT_1435645 [Mucidula mucida]